MANAPNIAAISGQLELIVEQAKALEARFADELAQVHPEFRASARNLLAYIALRQIGRAHV